MLPIPAIALYRRETLRAARKPAYYIFAALLFLVGSGVIYAFWPDPDMFRWYGTNSFQQLFMSISVVVVLGPSLLLTFAGATAITVERERDTFDLLQMTYVSKVGLLLAKLAQIISLFFMGILTLLPIVGALYFHFGLDTAEVQNLVLASIITGISFTASGLLCSCIARSTFFALFLGLIAIFLLYSGLFYLFYFLGAAVLEAFDFDLHSYRDIGNWLRSLAESVAPYHLFNNAGAWGGGQLITITWGYVASHTLVTIFSLALGARLLNRVKEPHFQAQEKPIDDTELLEARRKQFPYYLADPRKRKASIGDASNPALAREVRWGLYNRISFLFRVLYVSFIVFFIFAAMLLVANMADAYERNAIPNVALAIAIVVWTPPLVAPLFVREREQGNLDMLRMTHLLASEILIGKIAGAVTLVMPLIISYAAVLFSLFLFSWATDGSQGAVAYPLGFLVGIVHIFLAISVCVYESIRAKSTVAAIISSYLVIGALCFGLYCIAYFLWEMRLFFDFNITSMFTPYAGYLKVYNQPYYFSESLGLLLAYAMIFLFLSWRRFNRQGLRDT